MNYIITLHSKIDAKDEEEAKAKALVQIQVKEAAPMVLRPFEVYEQLREFHHKQKEHFIMFLLDTQNNLLRHEVISIGTLNSALIHPRELFRSAIIANSASVIVAHNHPSGSLEPSAEDLLTTKRLSEAGKLLGIPLVDHIIFTASGYSSLKERNLL